MATLEERLTVIEHEHAGLKHDNEELKQKIELHTIALGGLVNKATLESINEKNDKIFQALMAHDEFTNRQLAELRERLEVQVEGKIAGLQTEMRQGFDVQGKQIETLSKQTETLSKQMEQVLLLLNTLTKKPE